jgi:hypothetical protein
MILASSYSLVAAQPRVPINRKSTHRPSLQKAQYVKALQIRLHSRLLPYRHSSLTVSPDARADAQSDSFPIDILTQDWVEFLDSS